MFHIKTKAEKKFQTKNEADNEKKKQNYMKEKEVLIFNCCSKWMWTCNLVVV